MRDLAAALPEVFERDEPKLVFQPIVDLQRGLVVGHEVLSRFTGPPRATPDLWFEAASGIGRGVELEMRVFQAAMALRTSLPDDSFLSVNLSPEALVHETMRPTLRTSLERVVFEITEHHQVVDYVGLKRATDAIREAGGRIAVDDAGAGYASLRHVLELYPDFVKLDRGLVANAHEDDAVRAVIEMLGSFAAKMDAWIVAEGIEEVEELEALVSLGVPLGQGYGLARPAPEWGSIDPEIAARIRSLAKLNASGTVVARHVHQAPTLEFDEIAPAVDTWTVLLKDGRPHGLLRPDDPVPRPAMCVASSVPVEDAVRRAMRREESVRFDPVVVRLAGGGLLGLVRLERLIDQLAG